MFFPPHFEHSNWYIIRKFKKKKSLDRNHNSLYNKTMELIVSIGNICNAVVLFLVVYLRKSSLRVMERLLKRISQAWKGFETLQTGLGRIRGKDHAMFWENKPSGIHQSPFCRGRSPSIPFPVTAMVGPIDHVAPCSGSRAYKRSGFRQ